MLPRLAPIERCVDVAGLAPNEIVLGVAPNETHERALEKYRGVRRSEAMARARIVADLRAALERGSAVRAADLLIVLRRLLAFDTGAGTRRCAAWPDRRPRAAGRKIRRAPTTQGRVQLFGSLL
jgi:hypothetical protein